MLASNAKNPYCTTSNITFLQYSIKNNCLSTLADCCHACNTSTPSLLQIVWNMSEPTGECLSSSGMHASS